MSTRLDIRIRADKTGPAPAEGQPWPMRGVEIVGDPPAEFEFPTSWVRKERKRGWLTLENASPVERPSQPNPKIIKGSAAVSEDHRLDGLPTHNFAHADFIVLDTLSHGVLRYRVVDQPDKYADDGEGGFDNSTPVTAEIYDAGQTRVDHFYRAVLEG